MPAASIALRLGHCREQLCAQHRSRPTVQHHLMPHLTPHAHLWQGVASATRGPADRPCSSSSRTSAVTPRSGFLRTQPAGTQRRATQIVSSSPVAPPTATAKPKSYNGSAVMTAPDQPEEQQGSLAPRTARIYYEDTANDTYETAQSQPQRIAGTGVLRINVDLLLVSNGARAGLRTLHCLRAREQSPLRCSALLLHTCSLRAVCRIDAL